MVSMPYSEQMTLFPPPYRYIIDSCSIISQKENEPHRRCVYNSLWQKIDELIQTRESVLCSEIRDEIEDDVLSPWVQRCFVLDVDDAIQQNVTRIVNEHPELLDFANTKSSGDAFLIATAMQYKIAVITEEKPSPKKIPGICKAYGIPCYNITELAQVEGWVF